MISPRRSGTPTSRILLVLTMLLGTPLSPAHGDATARPSSLDQQRYLYQQALTAWESRDLARFARLSDQLRSYPLHPYLEFEHLRTASHARERERIDRFLTAMGDMPLANRLRTRLLDEFYAQGNWAMFRAYYAESVRTTALDCRYQEARFRDGLQVEATAAGLALWNVPRSQPAECDPLFELLRQTRAISPAVAWQRFAAAVRADQLRLASYLQQHYLAEPAWQSLTQRYLALYRDSSLLADTELFSRAQSDPEVNALIVLVVGRSAGADAALALARWDRQAAVHQFSVAARTQVTSNLARALHQQGRSDLLAKVLQERSELLDNNFHEWLLRRHIAAGDWRTLENAILTLPSDLQSEPQWRYWLARARVLTGSSSTAEQVAFADVATRRSFYGFAASDWIGSPYQMTPRATQPPESALLEFAARPAFQRIPELLHHRQEQEASREWWRATQTLDETEWDLAGRLAYRWGWHHQAIMAMIKANQWDDLETRFPILHQKDFIAQARTNDVPVALMLAVARQESAFRPDALSPAGARGLMQLMPATAAEVARNHGFSYQGPHQLIDPGLNIRLGARYYRNMLNRFQDHRVLATAAYNAGPGRVRQWLARSGGNLPFDAWIEAIPFNETRNYVQNVLAFSAIYAHRLGSDERILTPREREQWL